MVAIMNLMQAWGLPILGIVITVAIFVYQSRQSTGAETERRGRANQELTDLLVRRLILENYYPTNTELQKIREGLATEFNVDPQSLISNDSLESSVAYSVVANDYIEQSRRLEILARIRNANPPQDRSLNRIQARRGETEEEKSIFFEIWEAIREFGGNAFVAILASIIASLAGVLVASPGSTVETFFARFGDILIPTLAGGVLTIIIAAGVIRQRSLQKRVALERVSVRSELATSGRTESRVRALLFEAHMMGKVVAIIEGGIAAKCDFVIEREDHQKVAIEAKNSTNVSRKAVESWLSRLSSAVKESGSALGLLIVPDVEEFNEASKRYPDVKVIAEEELAGFIDDWAASSGTPALKAV